MPEGPELKYLCEKIKKIENKKLSKIVALSKRKIKLPNILKINRVKVKGKLLYLECDDEYFIHIHMGLSGWIYFEEQNYTKYILKFTDNSEIYIDDSRKFSKISIFKINKHHKIINSLGIDILSNYFSIDIFYNLIKSVNQNICSFMLNQHILCGIGNYIKNESLFMSKINPHRNTETLNDKEINKLYEMIKFVSYSNLIEMLMIDKIKISNDILKLKPKVLEIPYHYKIYGKESKNVVFEIIAGRKTYYDPNKQI